jgi:hypothetical protein
MPNHEDLNALSPHERNQLLFQLNAEYETYLRDCRKERRLDYLDDLRFGYGNWSHHAAQAKALRDVFARYPHYFRAFIGH